MRFTFLLLLLSAVSVAQLAPQSTLGPGAASPQPNHLELDTPRYRHVARLIEASVWDAMKPAHQRMLANLAVRKPNQKTPPPALCLHGNVADEVRLAFERAVFGDPTQELQLLRRWTQTATNPSVPSPGSPITLTYSFVPDGTFISSGAGEPAGPSDLIASFDAAFPSRAVWQGLYAQVFARWGAISGINYVFEPNDDGAALGSAPGVLGVRGDLRMGGHRIDGGSGILAYNPFPPDGDMVMDTADVGLYSNPSSNYLFIRNTLAHEHGHGQGILHVCPRTQTKLMEPFISTQFDGPQLDDILSAQRFYGDSLEPNETPATATDLGNLNLGLRRVSTVSLDSTSDTDVYRFTVPDLRELTATVRPIGDSYNEGTQTGSCGTAGTTVIDTRAFNDLRLQILDSDGTTVLATANANGAGLAETAGPLFLPSGAGTYFVRVLPGTTDQIQLYELDISLVAGMPPAFRFEYPNGTPSSVAPDTEFDVGVRIVDLASSVDPSTAALRVSTGGAFQTVPLIHLGQDAYVATLPGAPCDSTLSWWLEASPIGSSAVLTSPLGAPANRFSTQSEGAEVFNDNFEQAMGWSVTNSAGLTDGAWQRGVPIGGGVRGDPATADGGAGSAYVTANRAGNSDVDGGGTTLTSPVFNLAGQVDPTIEVAIWYDNVFGGNPGSDTFEIEISGNGGSTWQTLESYNQSTGAWEARSYSVTAALGTPTSSVRVRFIAQDLGGGSVVEAGVDSFRIVTCSPPAGGASLTGSAAAGTFGTDLLGVNFSTGGAARRVDVLAGNDLTFQLQSPTGSAAAFILVGKVGIPSAGDVLNIGGVGDMAFAPCIFAPTDPTLFTVADAIGGLACGLPILPAGPAPWAGTLPTPVGLTGDFAVQGIVLTGPASAEISNAILISLQ